MTQTKQNTTPNTHELYLGSVRCLKELQKIDERIHEKETALAEAPRLLQELEKNLKDKEETVTRIRDRLEILNSQIARLDNEAEEANERLRKSRDKLMDTSNEREYNAVTREIDNIEKSALPREDGRVVLLDELSRQQARLEEEEPGYLALKEEVETRRKTISNQMQKDQKELDKFLAERNAKKGDVPALIYERYEFIRERLEHPVIVSLSEAICPSCHIALPPQTFNELLRGNHIMNCPSCQRIIIWRDDYVADDPEAQRELAAEREREAAKPVRRTSMGRSAALDKPDFKEEKEEGVEFGAATGEDMDDDPMRSPIEHALEDMSNMADLSDLDMADLTVLGDLGSEENDENDPEK